MFVAWLYSVSQKFHELRQTAPVFSFATPDRWFKFQKNVSNKFQELVCFFFNTVLYFITNMQVRRYEVFTGQEEYKNTSCRLLIDPLIEDKVKSCHRLVTSEMNSWHRPPGLVRVSAMHSAPLSRLPLRAANFLLLGYTDCAISILCWAATGSLSRHWCTLRVVVLQQFLFLQLMLLLLWLSSI